MLIRLERNRSLEPKDDVISEELWYVRIAAEGKHEMYTLHRQQQESTFPSGITLQFESLELNRLPEFFIR